MKTQELDDLVDLGNAEIEEGSPADRKRREEAKQLFADVLRFYKKQQQLMDKANAVTPTNKKLRKKAVMKYSRARVETSRSIRAIPFLSAAGSSSPRNWNVPPMRWRRSKPN